MTDRREAILDRLVAIAGATDGIATAERNQDEVPEDLRPAAIVFDGSEEGSEEDNRRTGAPRRVTMIPHLVVLLGAGSETVGQAVNALRAKLIKTISLDPELADLTLDADGIFYLGCETNLEPGREAEVWLVLNFAFTYLLRPQDL